MNCTVNTLQSLSTTADRHYTLQVYCSYVFVRFSVHVCGRKQWHAIAPHDGDSEGKFLWEGNGDDIIGMG